MHHSNRRLITLIFQNWHDRCFNVVATITLPFANGKLRPGSRFA